MPTRRRPAALFAALVLPALLARPAPAHACGGMVFPDHVQRVGGMDDQELFVGFGADATVLVASAGYEGIAAADFAFILPLGSEPSMVLDADPALFVALDEYSAPRISIYVDDGTSDPVSCGFANDAGGGGGKGDFGGGDVIIHQRGTTATYEWVVIGGDTGTAVADWLTMSGYPLPADYAAALTPYVDAGRFFFAAKVKNAEQVGALAPIELHLPAMQPEELEIPFALAAHSLAPDKPLGITTYFWTGGLVLPANYGAKAVDDDDLVADSATESNYAALERSILDGDPMGAWLIDFSNDVYSPDEFISAYQNGADAGRYTLTPGGDVAIRDFFTRVGDTGGYLTRLRTELRADQLRDLKLRRESGPVVSNYHNVVFDDRPSSSSCAVDRSGQLAQLLLLVPVLAWIRPRRRRTT